MPRKRKPTTKATEHTETDKEKPPDLQWTDAMEAALFNAFLEQHNKGKRADLGWKTEAWGPVVEAVRIRGTVGDHKDAMPNQRGILQRPLRRCFPKVRGW